MQGWFLPGPLGRRGPPELIEWALGLGPFEWAEALARAGLLGHTRTRAWTYLHETEALM